MPFDPSNLTNLFVWLRADTDVFQDAAMATPCTDNTAVYTWKNHGSDPSNFVQSSAGNRPQFFSTAGFNNLPTITFTTDYLISTTASISSTTAITVFCVVRLSNPTGTGCLLAGSGAATDFQVAKTTPAVAYFYRGAGGFATGTWSLTRPDIFTCIFDVLPNTSYAWMDLATTPTPNGLDSGNAAVSDIRVGSGGNTSFPFDGDYYEVIIYNRKLTDVERLQVRAYLEAKYHIFPLSTDGMDSSENPDPVNRPFIGFTLDNQFYQSGVRRDNTEGNTSPPSMAIDMPGRWRFKWGVETGATRTLSIRVKQVSNVAGKRPRMIVKANPGIGVPSDVIVDAGAGTGWVDLGPASVTPTTNGVLDVELWNMDTDSFYPISPAFFDDLVKP
jgi:hypothetical protein